MAVISFEVDERTARLIAQLRKTSHLIQASNRVISEKVILALLGAITVQAGAIAVLIAGYPFPTR